MRTSGLPISVIIITKGPLDDFNSGLNLLADFGDVHIVHSVTAENDGYALKKICDERSFYYHEFLWNGQYPKKRQWCLQNLPLTYDWVFMLDADERMTPAFLEEIKSVSEQFEATHKSKGFAGYWVKSLYVINSKILKYGVTGKKLTIFDKNKFYYPVVNDLTYPGMGEVEGHYQPILREEFKTNEISTLKEPILHYAFERDKAHRLRHDNYAIWEAMMILNHSYPGEPSKWRSLLKKIFRKMPFREKVYFAYFYILKGGYLGGREGYLASKQKHDYYKKVRENLKILKTRGIVSE